MKPVAVIVVIAMAVAATLGADTYATTWDNLDLDKILSNDRLINAYTDCLLDKGKCAPEAAALKKILPEALKTDCAKCSEKQKEGAVKVVKYMVEKKPELWQQVVSKYDPDGTYRKKFASQGH